MFYGSILAGVYSRNLLQLSFVAHQKSTFEYYFADHEAYLLEKGDFDAKIVDNGIFRECLNGVGLKILSHTKIIKETNRKKWLAIF